MSFTQHVKRGAFTALAAAERAMRHPWNRPLSEARNFLLLQHASALGTAIHATPLIPALRHAVPDARIAVAASGFSLDVLRHNPGIDQWIETPNPVKDLGGAVRSLRGRIPFDPGSFITLTTSGNERTLIALQAMFSGAETRVGFTVAPELYQVSLQFDLERSQIANNLRIIDALGHQPKHFEPEIFVSESDRASAHAILQKAGVAAGQAVAIFVTQTSATQRKGWRAERFRAVATHLHQRYGAHILFVGATSEAAAVCEIQQKLPFFTTSVAGQTSISGLAALMQMATIGVTLDTGPMHIGRAAGLPMCIIAPAWSPPIEWLPVGDQRFRILKNLDLPVAPPDYLIDEVSVDEVTAALDDLMLAQR